MNCSLCTMDVLRGTMYRTAGDKHFQSGHVVCDTCRDAIIAARPEDINEPLCECGRCPEWVCRVAISGCPMKVEP